MCRCEEPLSRDIREKIALFVNLPVDSVVSARDVDSIYKVPLYFRAEGVDDQILDHFGIETETPDLSGWEALVKRYDEARDDVRIGLVGKYTQLEDAYLSVIEALGHGGAHHGGKVEVRWIDSEQLTDGDVEELEQCDGILIPGGFGVRGIEGKIRAAQYARENGVPVPGHLPRACRSRWPTSPATWPAWTAPTPPSSIPRRRSRSSTSCPSRRRCATWAARCAWARTR